MSEESESAAAAPRHLDSPGQDDALMEEDMEEEYPEVENRMEIKQEPTDPVPGTSQGNFFFHYYLPYTHNSYLLIQI